MTDSKRQPRHANRLPRVVAAFACAAGIAAAASILAGGAPAQTLQQKLDSTQAKLDKARSREGVLTSQIAKQSSTLDRLEVQVANLRNREAAVAADLRRKQAELERAQKRLEILRKKLRVAISTLEARLVEIYKAGEPDLISVVIHADGFGDLLDRADYLRAIHDQDNAIVDRVRSLRDQMREVVDEVKAARDRIAREKQELDRTRAALEARTSELAAARRQRQATLADVRDHRMELEGDLSDISDQIARQLAGGSTTLPAGPVRPGAHGLIWPVSGPITSPYGPRYINGQYEFHPGIDIAVPTGTPIRAAASGTVTIAGPEGGYGNYTCIDHGGGLSTCYGHQESFAVSVGQHVGQGQTIGYTDCTGYCFGPHLHFEVRINGQTTDPLGYL
jgi:murein DD-endopeptidase MepM/ murein hydrolase activator NlpD